MADRLSVPLKHALKSRKPSRVPLGPTTQTQGRSQTALLNPGAMEAPIEVPHSHSGRIGALRQILIQGQRPLVVAGLRSELRFTNAAIETTSSTDELLVECVCKLRPDILIMDVNDHRPAFRQIRELLGCVRISVIAIIQQRQPMLVERFLRAGIRGYLFDSCGKDHLRAAIETICKGRVYFDPLVSFSRAKPGRAAASVRSQEVGLSSVEREIATLIASDFRNKEIASELGLAVHTVENHRAAILRKLHARGTAGIVRFAIGSGLSDIPAASL